MTCRPHDHPEGQRASDSKDTEIHPVPLHFEDPRCDAPIYRPLEPSDDLYPLAAAACRIQERLGRDDRRAMMIGLSNLWPQQPGHRRERDFRSLAVVTALRGGRTVAEVAEEFCVEPDTVRRWRAHGERLLDEHGRAWSEHGVDPAMPRVETAFPDQAPPNCGDDLAYMRWLAASPTQAANRMADWERFQKLR